MQLGESKAIGVFDNHHRRIRNIYPHFDHRRCDQHVDLAGCERGHHALTITGRHLSVSTRNAQAL